MEMNPKALRDVINSHNQLLHAKAEEESKLAYEGSILEDEQFIIAEEMGHEDAEILKKIARITLENTQLKAEKVISLKEMSTVKKVYEKACVVLTVRYSSLELELEVQTSNKELTEELDKPKRRDGAIELGKVKESEDQLVVDLKSRTLSLTEPQPTANSSLPTANGLMTHGLKKPQDRGGLYRSVQDTQDFEDEVWKLGAETDPQQSSECDASVQKK